MEAVIAFSSAGDTLACSSKISFPQIPHTSASQNDRFTTLVHHDVGTTRLPVAKRRPCRSGSGSAGRYWRNAIIRKHHTPGGNTQAQKLTDRHFDTVPGPYIQAGRRFFTQSCASRVLRIDIHFTDADFWDCRFTRRLPKREVAKMISRRPLAAHAI